MHPFIALFCYRPHVCWKYASRWRNWYRWLADIFQCHCKYVLRWFPGDERDSMWSGKPSAGSRSCQDFFYLVFKVCNLWSDEKFIRLKTPIGLMNKINHFQLSFRPLIVNQMNWDKQELLGWGGPFVPPISS